jgi:16S rRNA (adenine1518-N6/adenine1519-N6)-dimethyltransferase
VSVSEVRSLLDRHGLAARRDLGQNFLVDAGVAERLVDLAGVEAGCGVLEIGTGLGILTRALAARGARVTSIEVDAGLVRALRADALLPEGVRLIHGDALALDLPALLDGLAPGARVVANLPYSVSAPLLRRLLDARDRVACTCVMLQRDVAQRLLAGPGSRAYGSLAVLHRLSVSLERVMELSPRCFFPVPGVRSTFVRMRPLSACRLSRRDLSGIEALVRAAFSKRRKTLANALRGTPFACDDELLAGAGVPPGARAEALAPETFVALSRALGLLGGAP